MYLNSPLTESNSFRHFLSYIGSAILLKCDEREKCGKESNRESSQVNRKWKENLRGKIKIKLECPGTFVREWNLIIKEDSP